MAQIIDLTGQRFGKLVAIEPSGSEPGHTLWKCQCDCGRQRSFRSRQLRTGLSTNCGCADRRKRLNGNSNHPLYEIWRGMLARCENPNRHDYHYYGGRGIGVCEEWHSLDRFSDWAMGSWKRGLTIDRIDPDGDYEPDNCRWADWRTQALNRRKTGSGA